MGACSDELLLHSRIIAFCGVYDALTAENCPYKKTVSTQQALEILQQEAPAGKRDAELLGVFY